MEDEENPHSRRGTVEAQVVNAVLSAEERYGEIPGGVRGVQGAEGVRFPDLVQPEGRDGVSPARERRVDKQGNSTAASAAAQCRVMTLTADRRSTAQS